MPLISEKDARTALDSYLPKIYDCIHLAWKDYLMYPDWARIDHSSTTRANIVHDHMIKRAIKSIVDDSSVKHFEWSRHHIFVFEQRISLRLKKLSQELMPQNIQTEQVKNLNCHELVPGIEAAAHLVAGYTLNKLETEVEDVYLVCPNNKKIYWELKLDGSEISSNVYDIFETIDENYNSEFERKEIENTEDEVARYDKKNQP
jgi:hypothetical protein